MLFFWQSTCIEESLLFQYFVYMVIETVNVFEISVQQSLGMPQQYNYFNIVQQILFPSVISVYIRSKFQIVSLKSCIDEDIFAFKQFANTR